ncbi:MAG: AI-2E family transporter [Candidatus Dojkabacteria bacterium]|jgi:predicted PurR-regulated permease PerM
MAKVYSVDTKESYGGGEPRRVLIDLSPTLLALIFFVLAVVFFGKQLVSIVLFLMLSFVFMCTMRPIVGWFMKQKVTKGWAIFLSYFSLLVFIVIILSIIIVPFINQVGGLINTLPDWIAKLLDFLNGVNIGGVTIDVHSVEKTISDSLKSLTTSDSVKNVTSAVGGVFNSFTTFLSATVLSIYLVAEHDSLADVLFMRIRSKEKTERVKKLIEEVEDKLGSWVLGQGTVSLIATLFSAIILSLFKVPFAIPLAVFVGIMDAIPSIGATLAGLAVGIVSLITVGPINAIIILVLMVLYQQVENNLIIPKVMGNVVGVKPFYIMIGVIILLILAGPLGAVIAVPFIVLIKILYEFYIDLQKLEAKGIVN